MAEEKKAEETTTEEVEVPKKFEKIVKEIEEMSTLDLSELVKVLEDKFGVSAAAPAVAAAPAAGGGEEAAAEEKTEFDVVLKDAGSSKINVIKVVREVTGEGLAESKAMVEDAPKTLKEKASKEEAEDAKSKLEEAGATVELQQLYSSVVFSYLADRPPEYKIMCSGGRIYLGLYTFFDFSTIELLQCEGVKLQGALVYVFI